METLPDCVLLKIFRRLSGDKSLLWQVRGVCWKWHDILLDGDLWRATDFTSFKLDRLRELLHKAPVNDIHFVQIHDKAVDEVALRHLFLLARNTQALSLKGCNVNKCEERQKPKMPKLTLLDLRGCTGNLKFVNKLKADNMHSVKVLGLSSGFAPYLSLHKISFSRFPPQLTVLEVPDCVWMNDETLQSVSYNCAHLKLIDISGCINVMGASLSHLLANCLDLQSLFARKTGLRDVYVSYIDWSSTQLTELDVANCYYLGEETLYNLVVLNAHRLEYLSSAMSDEILNTLEQLPLKLQVWSIRRRVSIDTQSVLGVIVNCSALHTLDLSMTPVKCEEFEEVLPHLEQLQWLKITAHKVLRTEAAILLIALYCPLIRSFGLNCNQGPGLEEEFSDAFPSLINQATRLKEIAIEGAYINTLVTRLLRIVRNQFADRVIELPITLDLPTSSRSINSRIGSISRKL